MAAVPCALLARTVLGDDGVGGSIPFKATPLRPLHSSVINHRPCPSILHIYSYMVIYFPPPGYLGVFKRLPLVLWGLRSVLLWGHGGGNGNSDRNGNDNDDWDNGYGGNDVDDDHYKNHINYGNNSCNGDDRIMFIFLWDPSPVYL